MKRQQMSNDRLRESLIRHEGKRLKPYLDCCGKPWRECICAVKGKLTIGVGRNIDDIGLSDPEAMLLLSNDIERVLNLAVNHLAWFKSLSMPRQDVVLEMVFNLGLSDFLEFKSMISAITRGDFGRAADEMISSHWYQQIGARAQDLAKVMRSGSY